ncbi:hypothetical protein [Streptomyces tauricus]
MPLTQKRSRTPGARSRPALLLHTPTSPARECQVRRRAAEAERLPKRRDLAVAAVQERIGEVTTNPDAEYIVRLNRALFM